VTIVDAHVSGGLEVGGDAPLAVAHGSDPQLSEIVLEMDLDNDGDFSEPEENLTGFLLTGESLSGRDRPSPVAGVAVPGTLRVQLNNDGDQFSRYNQASPFNAAPFSLQPGRKIRVRTAESVPDDPVLLARDRFNRPDGACRRRRPQPCRAPEPTGPYGRGHDHHRPDRDRGWQGP
jgi:hypothetical protein